MTDAFDRLKSIIQSEKYDNFISTDAHDFPEACHQNLLNALKAVGSHNKPGTEELVGLIRHVLRREDEDLQGGIPQSLKVPRRFPYPGDRETWQHCGIEILDEKRDYFLICAHPWQPEWLELCDRHFPEQPAFAETPRRNYPSVSGDPFLALVARESYRSGERNLDLHFRKCQDYAKIYCVYARLTRFYSLLR
jgi:ATP-dependent DNA helicase RecQ